MQIVIGIILVIAGILLVIFSRYIFDNFGRIAWAEEKLGGAGTLSLIRIIGAALILFGFAIWTGLFGLLFGDLIRTLFRSVIETKQNQTNSSLLLQALTRA